MSLPNLDPPYFVQYLVDESTNFTVSASLGGLLSRRAETVRAPEVRVRVGDYKFDNTNYAGSGFNFGVALRSGAVSRSKTATTCCGGTCGCRPTRRTNRPSRRSPANAPRCGI